MADSAPLAVALFIVGLAVLCASYVLCIGRTRNLQQRSSESQSRTSHGDMVAAAATVAATETEDERKRAKVSIEIGATAPEATVAT